MKQNTGPFKKFEFSRKWYNDLMSYINAFNPLVPEAETVITNNNVDFIFNDYSFYPSVFSQYMI